MKRRILYLPIETKVRELLGKTLLAAKAAERGWLVVLGDQQRVRQASLRGPPGVFVEISIPDKKAERLCQYRSLGHRIVNLCEENIVYLNGLDYCRTRVGPNALASVDLMLVPGARNETHLRQHCPGSAGKIAVTGNPRFDTLLPGLRAIFRSEAAAIGGRFGRFLLVNTNFGRVNPFHPAADPFASLVRRGMIESEAQADFFRRLRAYKLDQMAQLKRLLVDVAAAGMFDRVVIRPHPGENHDHWRQWAAPHGIEAQHQGSANGWMLAAEAVLHTGCTTGIEGLLLGRPVVSFAPRRPGDDMLNPADDVSLQVANAEELLAQIAEWRSAADHGEPRLQAYRARLASLIANVDPPLSVERILDALDGIDAPESPAGFDGRLRHGLPGVLAANLRARLGSFYRSRTRQKFPGLTTADFQDPIDCWRREGVLGRDPSILARGDGTWALA